jgi:ketosteroid isomerase-like protein
VEGKPAFRESIDEWLSAWVSAAVKWTGRLGGVAGDLPIHIMFTVRDGKIARVDWFPDQESTVAAARGA